MTTKPKIFKESLNQLIMEKPFVKTLKKLDRKHYCQNKYCEYISEHGSSDLEAEAFDDYGQLLIRSIHLLQKLRRDVLESSLDDFAQIVESLESVINCYAKKYSEIDEKQIRGEIASKWKLLE
jgi:hypothetical protein